MRKFSQALTGVLGPDECVLFVGLLLIVIGLWPLVGRMACAIPGAVLIWMSLPSRSALIHRPPVEPPRRRRVS